jgi:hypothetical protein
VFSPNNDNDGGFALSSDDSVLALNTATILFFFHW